MWEEKSQNGSKMDSNVYCVGRGALFLTRLLRNGVGPYDTYIRTSPLLHVDLQCLVLDNAFETPLPATGGHILHHAGADRTLSVDLLRIDGYLKL